MKRGNKNYKLKKNPTALIAAIILMVGAFLFPISRINIMGTSTADRNYVLFNLIEDAFANTLKLEGALQILPYVMGLIFIFIFFGYLLSGFGLLYNRYAKWGSYLTFLYLFFGLWLINKLNIKYGSPIIGTLSNYTGVGAGIYLVPFIGILYLIFNKAINRKLRF